MAVKGQNIRLYLEEDSQFVAGATNLTLNIQLDMQDASTKDTTNGWETPEPVGLSWDVSTDALVFDDDPVSGITGGALLADMIGPLLAAPDSTGGMEIAVCMASGDNNRTKGDNLISGSVIPTGMTINAQNRQNATYTAQFSGAGMYL